MTPDFQYNAETESVQVSVNVSYLGEYTEHREAGHIWMYSITIKNCGNNPIKLCNRNWEIMNERGVIRKVTGTGIVGEQPIIKTGEKFEYTSGTYLPSYSGIMRGYYEFSDEKDKKILKVKIPAFSLDIPDNTLITN